MLDAEWTRYVDYHRLLLDSTTGEKNVYARRHENYTMGMRVSASQSLFSRKITSYRCGLPHSHTRATSGESWTNTSNQGTYIRQLWLVVFRLRWLQKNTKMTSVVVISKMARYKSGNSNRLLCSGLYCVVYFHVSDTATLNPLIFARMKFRAFACDMPISSFNFIYHEFLQYVKWKI